MYCMKPVTYIVRYFLQLLPLLLPQILVDESQVLPPRISRRTQIFRGAVEMLLWLFLPLASGWWWDEKMDVNKRVEQQEEEDLNDYLEDYRGEVALERMDLGEYAYYYYEYPEDRQAGVLSIFNSFLHHRLILNNGEIDRQELG